MLADVALGPGDQPARRRWLAPTEAAADHAARRRPPGVPDHAGGERLAALDGAATWSDRTSLLWHTHADQLEHGGPHALEIHPGGHQDADRDPLTLAEESQEEVLGADVPVPERQRLTQRELEHLLGPGGEGRRAGRNTSGPSDRCLDPGPHGLQPDPLIGQRLGGHPVLLGEQTQQEVLGPEEAVVEEARLLLGQDEDPAGPVGESLEHRS